MNCIKYVKIHKTAQLYDYPDMRNVNTSLTSATFIDQLDNNFKQRKLPAIPLFVIHKYNEIHFAHI